MILYITQAQGNFHGFLFEEFLSTRRHDVLTRTTAGPWVRALFTQADSGRPVYGEPEWCQQVIGCVPEHCNRRKAA